MIIASIDYLYNDKNQILDFIYCNLLFELC